MIATTADFTTAATATVRKARARATVTWSDPFIDLTISTTASQENLVNFPDQVADTVEATLYKWAHIHTGLVPDGTFHPMPASELTGAANQVGWWGNVFSGAGGSFSAPYPSIEVTFAARSIQSVLVCGDNMYSEYPVDFTLAIYNGATLEHTETVTGNTLVRYVADLTAENINSATKIVLTITKWSAASKVVKIYECYGIVAEVYDGDDILSLNLIEEAEIADGSLPIGNISANEIDLRLQNIENRFFPGNTSSPLYTMIKRNRRIEPEIGFELPDGSVEYVSLGVFWSGDWTVPENGTYAETAARDRMEHLRKADFSTSEVYENTTLYDLAEIICEDARAVYPDMEYNIDSALSAYTIPYAYFKKQSYFSCLKDIAIACMGQVYCDRYGVVQIAGPA